MVVTSPRPSTPTPMLRSLPFSLRNGMSLLWSPHNLTQGENAWHLDALAIWLDVVRAGRPPSPEEGWSSRARGGHQFPKLSLGRAQIQKEVVYFLLLFF
ncbi:hypothetical protein V8C35DRAFT_61525 [Trichoderma chlorosporum]